MDLQEQSALDLANHVAAKVKERARPWRAIISLALAIAAAGISAEAGSAFTNWFGPGFVVHKIVTASAAAAFCLFAVMAVIGLAAKAREVLQPRTGSAHAAVVRYTTMLVGGMTTLIIALALFKVPVGQLILGGAVTTILIGIAAQQSLGNIFAGIVLLLSRPFAVGDSILVRSGALGGPIQGTVTEIGITYVRLDTSDGVMHLPNSQMLAAGVGHVRPPVPGPDGSPGPPRQETPTLPEGMPARPQGPPISPPGVRPAGNADAGHTPA